MAAGKSQRRIAFALDQSSYSETAIDWYIDNVYSPGDYFVLIHVPEDLDTIGLVSMTSMDLVLKSLEDRVKKMQDYFKNKLEAKRIPAMFRLGFGKPGEVIVKILCDEQVDCVVTGTRGLGVIRRTIMGSVSDYIVNHSPVPVLVCRTKK